MITEYVYNLANKMGIKLSHVSIHNNAAFSNCDKKSLKISSGGRLEFVPYAPEELMYGTIGEELKIRIWNVLTNISELSKMEPD